MPINRGLNMPHIIRSFSAIVDDNSLVLILGTMPGRESLEKEEYYANNRNSFWKIIFMIFDSQPERTYKQKIAFLNIHGIAIWDVLKECRREGSSDNKIKNEIPNDFNDFFERYPKINSVFYNGGKACELFNHQVRLEPKFRSILVFKSLTSTSPANARPIESKIGEWRAIRTCLEAPIHPNH